MMKYLHGWKLSLVVVAALATLLSACGSDDNNSKPQTDGDIDISEFDFPDADKDTQQGAIIEASPLTVDFGDVAVDEEACSEITLRNTGTIAVMLQPIRIETNAPNGVFYDQDYPQGNLLANETKTFSLCFKPNSEDMFEATAYIDNSSTNMPTLAIALTGFGIIPQEKTLGVNGLDANGGIDFGEVTVGSIGAMKTVTIKNIGSGDSVLNVYAIAIDEFNCTTPEAFSVQLNGTDTISQSNPLTLRAGSGSYTFGVIYRPQALVNDTCTLYIETDADNVENGRKEITLTGTGVEAELTLDPTPVDFGTVTIGVEVSKTVTLKNNSQDTVHINYAQLAEFTRDGDFTLDENGNSDVDIPAGGSIQYIIKFRPHEEGENRGYLKVVTNMQSASILYFPVVGIGGGPNQPPIAHVSETSHGAEINEHLYYEKGHTQTFYADGSRDTDSQVPINVFKWEWLEMPDDSLARFTPNDHSSAVTITFDVVGDYRFSLKVKDNEGAWSAPKIVYVSVVSHDDIMIEMSYGCDGEINVELGWQPPNLSYCTQENATGSEMMCPSPAGENYGTMKFLKTSDGCADGATEILSHTGSEVDGAYRIRVRMLEDCTFRVGSTCLSHDSSDVTVKIYINDETQPRWTLTTTLSGKGDSQRWVMQRVYGEFKPPEAEQ